MKKDYLNAEKTPRVKERQVPIYSAPMLVAKDNVLVVVQKTWHVNKTLRRTAYETGK